MKLRRVKRFDYFYGNAFSADQLFARLDPQAFDSLKNIKQMRLVPAGSIICARGIQYHGFYILRAGQAQWIVDDKAGSGRVPIRLLEPNEIVGLTEMLAELPYETEIESLTSCFVEFIDETAFCALLSKETSLTFQLVKLLGAGLHKSHRLLRSRKF